jgi:hypothetical protein
MAEEPFSPSEFAAAFRRFLDFVNVQGADASPLLTRIADHLGADPRRLTVTVEEFDAFEHPNVQVALNECLARAGRENELIGAAIENKRFGQLGLSDLLSRRGLAEGPADFVNFHLDGDRVLPCLQFGLNLVRNDGARLLVFVAGPSNQLGPRTRVRVEVLGPSPEAARGFLAELAEAARRLNVYRGHVISLSPGQMGMGPQTLVAFQPLPRVERTDVVLPAGLLERVERHTVGFSRHTAALLAAGRSLKRGLLLHGLPGTGKTLVISYLARQMGERTVLLTTGRGLGLTREVVQMARALAPAMVVIEDVDLIAEHRGQPFIPAQPLLFDLLNEMDGLRDDSDVIFALTTNRPDLLEPALAARPGRIDLAVELPLPDADGRRSLFELYSRGLSLEGVDLDALVPLTEGVSPAYIKELLRKAALLAAEAGSAAVRQEHVTDAMTELGEGGRLAERLLGFRPEAPPPAGAGEGAGPAWSRTGFPMVSRGPAGRSPG